MAEPSNDDNRHDDVTAFNRRFRNAVIAYAVIEFIALATLVYYKCCR
jgi:uncharacterized membrane protein